MVALPSLHFAKSSFTCRAFIALRPLSDINRAVVMLTQSWLTECAWKSRDVV